MLRSLSGKNYIIQVAAGRLLGPLSFQRGATSAIANYDKEKSELEKKLKEELPGPYEGPERDLVNFPRRKRAMLPGKVRMGFLPEEWFEFFYKKTGVTGPYVFGTGLITYLLSKEWYVIEEEFSTGCTILLLVLIAVKKFGPAVTAYRNKLEEEEISNLYKQKEGLVSDLENQLSDIKKTQWQMEGQKILMDAKRENVLMQLETEYRRRLMNVYEQTKRRLDYHLELYNTKRKLEQTHMVDWIVSNVVKSITPEQEKEALKKCVEDLNALAVKV